MTVNYRMLGVGHWLLVCGLSRLVDPFLSIQNEGSGMPHFTGSLVNQSSAVHSTQDTSSRISCRSRSSKTRKGVNGESPGEEVSKRVSKCRASGTLPAEVSSEKPKLNED